MRTLLIFILNLSFLSSIAFSQLSMNVLSKMQIEYDFKTQSIIQRMIESQENKVAAGDISEFEAKCISINTVDLLGNKNADRLIRIYKAASENQAPSVVDQNFMEEISKRYLNFMRIIVAECSDAELAIAAAKQGQDPPSTVEDQ